MLDREFKYYIDHQSELLKRYNGRYVVIVGNEVVSTHDDYEEALFGASKKYAVGTFLVQKCTEGEKAYTQTFHSRVIF